LGPHFPEKKIALSRVSLLCAALAGLVVTLWLAAMASAASGAASHVRPTLGEWVLVPPVTSEDLRDVHMVSSNLGWAVGENGTVLRYNGTAWQPINISTTDTLVDVLMLSAGNGYILGWSPTGSDIFHYDGTSWSLQQPITGTLNRMGASSASNIWAVGLNFTVHWNGSQWNIVPMPVDRMLFGVAVPSETEAWAVGQYEPVSQHGLILHSVGVEGAWTQVASPAPQTIFDVFARTPTDIWASGSAITDTYVLHYTGTQWTRVFTNAMQLNRLYMLTATDGWAISGISGVIAHYDGTDFTPVNNPGTHFINGINMLSQNEGWIVGGGGTTLHYLDTPPTPSPTATPCPMSFTDVHETDYFYEAVRYLYCRGVVSGYGSVFLPNNLTTRGQLTKIVTLAEGWTAYIPPTPTFQDVPTDHPFYQYIETAYHQGIISGYSCGTGCLEFRPGATVTRGQLCKIIVLAEGWPIYTPPTPTFRDVPETDPFYQHIETAYSRNIISGYGCGTNCLEFRPGNSATRGQICKIVYNAVTAP